MNTKLLCDILAPAQIDGIAKIIDKAPPEERIKQLKEYLLQFNKELDKKGVDSNYLAYSVEYALTKQPQKPTKKGPKNGN